MSDTLKYFAIKRPGDGYVGWLHHTEFDCWQDFFKNFPCPTSRYEGKKAYKAIGYECVEVSVKELTGTPGY